jgi:hypothetical protein
MATTKKTKRNAKGDIDFGIGKFDWSNFRKAMSTYVFHYYDEEWQRHRPYFNLFDTHDDDIEKAINDPEFYEKQLYWTPDHPPYDFYIHYHNWQLGLLVEFFKEVFEERAFQDGYQPQHKYFRVILPKSRYAEIMNCINDYELLHIRDLIFEVISTAQHKYVEDIAFWEKPENKILITSAEKETQNVIDIIEKLEDRKWINGLPDPAPIPELYYVNFVFSDGAIKVKHNWLAKEFVKHFRDYYKDLHYKNWRLDLERYPARFEENIHDQQFKYRLVKSFYNLFTVAGFFKITKKEKTPNKLMLCIAKLVEFCLIPIGDADELDEIKVKTIRNWVTRKELKPDITWVEPKQKKSKLPKYFHPDLRIAPQKAWRADAINIGCFIGKRFNIEHLMPELIHIAQSLKEGNMFRGHQITAGGIPQAAPFPEFDTFRNLVNGVKNKKKITSLKFKLDGDDKEYDLLQRLPLHLIEQAIKEYSEDHQVEIDTDLYKTTITDLGDGKMQVTKADHFNLPEERFMVRFVKSFFDFLLKEAPPGDRDMLPSERYYEIISIMLKETWFFYNKMISDGFTKEKVKQWHDIALGK